MIFLHFIHIYCNSNSFGRSKKLEKDKEDEKGETYILTEEVHNIRSEATESFRHLIEFFENIKNFRQQKADAERLERFRQYANDDEDAEFGDDDYYEDILSEEQKRKLALGNSNISSYFC